LGALESWHLIVILVIVLVVFGPGKLPQLGKAVGLIEPYLPKIRSRASMGIPGPPSFTARRRYPPLMPVVGRHHARALGETELSLTDADVPVAVA